MINHRIRILSSLLLAFIVVNIYGNLTGIKNTLANFKFPALKFNLKNNNEVFRPLSNVNYSFSLPAISQPSPTPLRPSGFAGQAPTLIPTTSTGIARNAPTSKIPTQIPQPTKIPKPTAVPALPPITSDTRPGSSLTEVFQEVSKRACIPAALLSAFQTEESGAFFNRNNSASIIKIYNTYGWWKTGAGDPCFGLGYHTQTGIVPSDSVSAGTRCQNAIPSGDDQGIMGVLQVSQFEQDATRKYTTKILSKNIDRRVLFDNALIFAIATKNRIGITPKSCTDWSDDEVQIAAEKHYGSCADHYCADVLKYYKQYR